MRKGKCAGCGKEAMINRCDLVGGDICDECFEGREKNHVDSDRTGYFGIGTGGGERIVRSAKPSS